MDLTINQSTQQFDKIFFHILKCLACNAVKTDHKKKRMDIANFINMYTNMYTYIICGENDSK